MIFFPVKAEIPYFSDLNLGGMGGLVEMAVFFLPGVSPGKTRTFKNLK